MKKEERSYLRFRIFLVLIFFLLFFGAIFARAFQLQVMDGPELKKMAANQHIKTITVQSKRGDIYDRYSRELAVSIDVDSVYAQPNRIKSPRTTARVLAKVLGVSWSTLERQLRSDKKFVWIKRQVDLDDSRREEIEGLGGVGLVKESRRYYPNRTLAANLLGFAGVDSVGLEGVEIYYDVFLRGATRKITGDRDAMGRLLIYEDTDKTVPLEGMRVELTIDKTIQYIAEKALKKAVEGSGADGGMAVVMSPRTGEILAMANLPTFDPNRFKEYPSSSKRNRAVTDTFEPGSVMKVFLVAAALEEGVINTDDIFFCENGKYRVADRVFHDVKKHGWLTVPKIIKFSSNIGASKIGERLGEERLYRYMKRFGFSSKTGVDIPGETSGSLRHYSDWSRVTLHTVSFGQGISATALQLAASMSSIANGGYMMKPYIVKGIKTPDGKVVKESAPEILGRVISPETSQRMTEMLVGVTEAGGTGTRGAVEGFEVAGKTGTAQKPDLEKGGYKRGAFMASFLGFVPASDPELTIFVALDEPEGVYHGGTVAAPVFREIASESLSYLGIYSEPQAPQAAPQAPRTSTASQAPPAPAAPVAPAVVPAASKVRLASFDAGQSEPFSYGEVKVDGAAPGVVPDFSGKSLRMVLRAAQSVGVPVDVTGSGVAIKQSPEAGGKLGKNTTVRVWLR
ncbi:MAG TPA: penicillin-binding protein [Thermodesulfobacteriota bacterium]|nr:penicillin-binding protein [Thermodesulfobacteriota bacterium]